MKPFLCVPRLASTARWARCGVGMALAPRRLGPKHAALARALAGYGHGPLMHSLVHALCTLHACTRAPHHVPALSGHRRRRDSSWRLLLCAAASAAPCLPATGEAFGAVIVAVDLSERGLHGKAAITNSTKQVFLRSLASAFVTLHDCSRVENPKATISKGLTWKLSLHTQPVKALISRMPPFRAAAFGSTKCLVCPSA